MSFIDFFVERGRAGVMRKMCLYRMNRFLCLGLESEGSFWFLFHFLGVGLPSRKNTNWEALYISSFMKLIFLHISLKQQSNHSILKSHHSQRFHWWSIIKNGGWNSYYNKRIPHALRWIESSKIFCHNGHNLQSLMNTQSAKVLALP